MAVQAPQPFTVVRVPANSACASIVGTAAAAALLSAGLSDSRSNEARCVIEALCLDAVLRCSESPEDEPTIQLTVEVKSDGVSLRLHDRGLPIAPNRSAIRRAKQLAAAGCVDHLTVIGVSPDGPTADVFVAFPPATGPTLATAVPSLDEVVLAPADEVVTFRRMVPGDSEAFALLAFRCYGYDYKRSAYIPDDIDDQLRDHTRLAGIAENEAGEMIGHISYQRVRPGGSVLHGGAGMVDPRYRKRGLLGSIGTSLHALIADEDVVGMIGEPVMVHTVTQKQAHILGYDTGVFLNWSNPRRVAGFDDGDVGGRVSVLCAFIPLAEIPHRDLYPPPAAVKHLAAVIASSGLDRSLHEPVAPLDREATCIVLSDTDPGTGIAKFEVIQSGFDLIDRIIELLDDALAGGSPVVILDLPLSEPSIGWCAAGVGELGFVFAALLPECAVDGDILRLQYVVDLNHDSSGWKIHSPTTVDLVASIVEDVHLWHDRQSASRRSRIHEWRQHVLDD